MATTEPLMVWRSSEVASGGGERGPWQQNESRYDYVDDPAVALDDRGEAAVAWVEQRQKDVFFQRLADDGSPRFAEPVNVSRSPASFSWLPRIVVAGPDVFVVWQEIIFSGGSHGGEIFFARSSDGGARFSPPLNLSNSIGGDGKGRITPAIWHNGSLDLALAADGSLYAAWTDYDGPLWFSRSLDGGRHFSRPRQVAGSGDRPARAPSLAVAPDGIVYLAWTTGGDPGADVHLAKSADRGGHFAAPVIVAPSRNYSDAPKLAVAGDGVVHLVYAESSGGPFARHQVRYTRSVDGGRSFRPAQEISRWQFRSNGGAGFPSLAIDGRGRLYVVWELLDDGRASPRGLGMAVSTDKGRQFSPPVPVPGSSDPAGGRNGSQQGLLMKKLAVNRHGAVAIVNSSLKEGEGSRVWLMRTRFSAP